MIILKLKMQKKKKKKSRELNSPKKKIVVRNAFC